MTFFVTVYKLKMVNIYIIFQNLFRKPENFAQIFKLTFCFSFETLFDIQKLPPNKRMYQFKYSNKSSQSYDIKGVFRHRK